MRKIVLKIFFMILVVCILFSINSCVKAANSKEELLKQEIEYYSKDMDINNLTKEDVLKIYDEINDKYTNEELANMLEDNKEEIRKQGISEEVISAGAEVLKNTDTNSVREIIENDIDFENIKEKVNDGYTTNQIVKDIVKETPTEQKINIATKLLLSNRIVKNILIVLIILFVYETILRWIIYKKAGKKGWAAIIPLYRQIVMYKICGLSPWLMLLWFVPIFGWIAMLVIAIMKRFCISYAFGKRATFGFGVLILPLIFKSILAFNKNIKYEGE